jgi:hypothetical protein
MIQNRQASNLTPIVRAGAMFKQMRQQYTSSNRKVLLKKCHEKKRSTTVTMALSNR